MRGGPVFSLFFKNKPIISVAEKWSVPKFVIFPKIMKISTSRKSQKKPSFFRPGVKKKSSGAPNFDVRGAILATPGMHPGMAVKSGQVHLAGIGKSYGPGKVKKTRISRGKTSNFSWERSFSTLAGQTDPTWDFQVPWQPRLRLRTPRLGNVAKL